MRVVNLLTACAGGVRTASIDAYTDTTAPVAASGTATITYASLAADDTIVIGGVTLTCKASGATAGTEFNKQTDATTSATNLATAINANTTLKEHVVATAAAGVVTVKAKVKGTLGNLLVMSTSNSDGITLVQLTGGTGGAHGTATTYSLGM